MPTPSVTTAALPGDSAAIQAPNTVPEAPFDALMALIAPAVPAAAAAGSDAAIPAPAVPAGPASLVPVEAATSGAVSGDAVSVLPPASPAMPAPVSVPMVNAADAAENDLAALLAASSVAGRGVTARAPAPLPVMPPLPIVRPLAAEPMAPAVPPEPVDPAFIGPVLPPNFVAPMATVDVATRPDPDFIGPVRPPNLVAPLATLDVATRPDPDFIGPALPQTVATVVQVETGRRSADFIGPVLPPDHALAKQTVDAVWPQEGQAPIDQPNAVLSPIPLPTPSALPVSMQTASTPVPSMSAAPAQSLVESGTAPSTLGMPVMRGVTQLPAAQALLQPVSESSAKQQSTHPVMVSADISLHPSVTLPPSALSVDSDDAAPQPVPNLVLDHAAERPVIVMPMTIATANRDTVNPDRVLAAASLRLASPPEPIVITTEDAPSPGAMADPAEPLANPRRARLADQAADAIAVVVPADANAIAVLTATPHPADPVKAKAQTPSGDNSIADAVLVPVPRPPVALSSNAIAAQQDGSLLRVMASVVNHPPAEPKRTKADRSVIETPARATLAGPAEPDMVETLAEPLHEDSATVTPRMRTALDRLDRDGNSRVDGEHAPVSAPRAEIDSRVAAMVRSVEILSGNNGEPAAALGANVQNATQAPIVTAETVTRDAPIVSSVAADGRRDTQRDAETRERQIKQQVLVALRAGTPELRMQLYPPGLGQVMIRLALDGQKLRLSMKADTAEAADALSQAETGLRDALSRDGFSLAGFDVHDDEQRGRKRRDAEPPASSVSNPVAGEAEAFSVDMTA